MANKEHLKIARKGKDAWNAWRQVDGANVPADFSGTDFTQAPNDNINFAGFDFGDANFSKTIFGDLPFAWRGDPDQAAADEIPLRGAANFLGAAFGGDATFVGAAFGGTADFEGAAFGGTAYFEGAAFGGTADFEGAAFGGHADFEGAAFGGRAGFEGAAFGRTADFRGAAFGGRAGFEGAAFGGDAWFQGAAFGGTADFEGAAFGGTADFEGAAFGGTADFEGAAFGGDAWFQGATFGGYADFEGAAFGGRAWFRGAAFGGTADFEGAAFGGGAWFQGAAFGGTADFDGAAFGGDADFSGGGAAPFDQGSLRKRAQTAAARMPEESGKAYLDAIEKLLGRIQEVQGGARRQFRQITFASARFRGNANFADREFTASANFSHARFDQPPDFRGTTNQDQLDWAMARFGFAGRLFGLARLPGWTSDTEKATRLRRLRKIAADIHDHDAERDLFVLERKAERGIRFVDWWHDCRLFQPLPSATRSGAPARQQRRFRWRAFYAWSLG